MLWKGKAPKVLPIMLIPWYCISRPVPVSWKLGVSVPSLCRWVILLSVASTAAYSIPWTHSIDSLWKLVSTANSRVQLSLLPLEMTNDFEVCRRLSSVIQHCC